MKVGDVGSRRDGDARSAAPGRGLAMLRLDRVADALASGTPLMSGGIALHPVKPAWARFDWPGEAKGGGVALGRPPPSRRHAPLRVAG